MPSKESEEVAKANSDFSNSLYQTLSKNEGNLVFSPISVHSILSLAYQGAAGDTAECFKHVLKLPSAAIARDGYKDTIKPLNNIYGVTLNIANKIYVKSGEKLNSGFIETATNSFFSEVEEIKFDDNVKAAAIINSWANEKTHGKIQNIISDGFLDEKLEMIMINAIYFNGTWSKRFKEKDTKQEPFYLNEKKKIIVDMMHATDEFLYLENTDLDARILSIPYEDYKVMMVIILPIKKNGLEALQPKLASFNVHNVISNSKEGIVNVALPKFKVQCIIELDTALKSVSIKPHSKTNI